jgi:hypothetical protein
VRTLCVAHVGDIRWWLLCWPFPVALVPLLFFKERYLVEIIFNYYFSFDSCFKKSKRREVESVDV